MLKVSSWAGATPFEGKGDLEVALKANQKALLLTGTTKYFFRLFAEDLRSLSNCDTKQKKKSISLCI